MGLLKEPRDSEKGLAGKRGPTVFDRVVRWRKTKAKKSKFQKDFEKETKKGVRSLLQGLKKGARDVWDE